MPSEPVAATPYPEDGSYDERRQWVLDRGYPEDGTFQEQLEWVQANDRLPPKPEGGGPQTWAWARLSTEYLTAKAAKAEGKPTTRWLTDNEDWEHEEGWGEGVWLMPLDPGPEFVEVVRRPTPARMPGTQQRARSSKPRTARRTTRTGARSPPDDDGSPSPDPLARPPLTAALRVWLKTEIDRRSRERLKSERTRLRAQALREGWGEL
jgi:hypothetical protein